MAKNINVKFFDTWTEQSAYVLGYLFADGSLSERNGYRSVHLVSKDLQIIEKIKEVMESDHKIYCSKDNSYVFTFAIKYITTRLVELGLTPNKSKEGLFPSSIPKEYLSHFIRGYFDGNGHFTYEIHKGDKRRLISGFTMGSEDFGSGLIEVLHSLGLKKVTLSKVVRNRTKGLVQGVTSYYQIRYYTNDTKKLAELMYQDANIYIERKKNYYDQYK